MKHPVSNFQTWKLHNLLDQAKNKKHPRISNCFPYFNNVKHWRKKNKTSTSFPFLQPPTSMVGVTVEVVGVTTPSVVGCSFTFLLQTVTSSCFVRQRFRDCTEGGVLSTSRFLSPWGFGRAGGVGKLGGKGYQGIEVVSSQRFLEDSWHKVRLRTSLFLVGEVGKRCWWFLVGFLDWGPACGPF